MAYKNRQYYFIGIAAIALSTAGSLPAQVTQVSKQAEAAKAVGGRGSVAGQGRDGAGAVRQAILANSITINGKRYPKLTTTRSSDPNASCDLGATQPFVQAASISLEGPKKARKDVAHPPSGPEVAVWSPTNPDWVVQSYSRVVTTNGGTFSASASGMPSGFSTSSTAQFEAVKQATLSYIYSLSIPEVVAIEMSAEANSMVSNSASYAVSLSMSHSGVRHQAQVWGTGIANTKQGHSWYHGHVNGSMTCFPAYLRDMNAMQSRMKQWVDQTVAALPRELQPAQPVDAVKR